MRAEKIHEIKVTIYEGEGLLVVRDDCVFVNDKRVKDAEEALKATQREMERLQQERERPSSSSPSTSSKKS
jgi:hypothetical protein